MMYIRYPLSLRRVKGLLFARGIDIYSSGGSMEPADAYTAFRGRLPSPDALLEKEGLDGG